MPRSVSGSCCSWESAEVDRGRRGVAGAGRLVVFLDPVAVVPGAFHRAGAGAFPPWRGVQRGGHGPGGGEAGGPGVRGGWAPARGGGGGARGGAGGRGTG